MKHILSIDQFDRKMMDQLFPICHGILKLQPFKEVDGNLPMAGKTLATVFFEPSTRTRLSFESAFIKLGGQILSVENAFDNSSNAKGESFLDTIRTISNYTDFIVFRHPETDSASKASKVSNCPIINAGDGAGEHPTQALLDLYTIWKEKKKIDGLKIGIVGDLKHARTINSLKKALANFDVEIVEIQNFNRPGCVISNGLISAGMHPEADALKSCDVVYFTRFQEERQEQWGGHGFVIMLSQDSKIIKDDAIVLHPLPRGNEIYTNFDNDPRAKYWDQVKNGLVVRQALILALAGYIKL